MYTPERLTIINLLSHRKTVWEFPKGIATLIIGQNKDDDGQESNGSGKSALIEGISLAITGKPFRKVKDVDLIYYGEKNCNIILDMTNEIRSEKFSISRNLFSKSKSSTLECFINDEPVTSFPTVLDGNKWILNKIGLSREDIINYFIVSKSKSVSFFGQSDTDKKAIVSRFSGTDPLLPIKDQLSKESKVMESEDEELDKKMLKLVGKGEAFQEQLDTASTDDQKALKKSRIVTREQGILAYENTIELDEASLVTYNKSLTQLLGKLLEVKHEKEAMKIVDYTAQLATKKTRETTNSSKILELGNSTTETQKEIDEIKVFKKEIDDNLLDSIECPKCHHIFILRDKEYNLEEAKAQLPELIEMLEGLEDSMTIVNDKIQKIRYHQSLISTEMEGLRKEARIQEDKKTGFDNTIRTNESNIKAKKLEITNCDTKIKNDKKTIEETRLEITNITNEKVIDPALEIGKSIMNNKEHIEVVERKMNNLKVKYVKHKEFEVIFTKFITHLSNKAVKSIEIKTNEYLGNMGSNLSIEIEGYKVNADGSIKEKFTTIVARDGIPEAFFESFSEGEQARIVIATTLALNSLLNMSCENGQGLSIVVLDELMGSLDPLGVGLTMEALNELGQTILAISHVEPRHKYSNTVIVEKLNGNSQIQ